MLFVGFEYLFVDSLLSKNLHNFFVNYSPRYLWGYLVLLHLL